MARAVWMLSVACVLTLGLAGCQTAPSLCPCPPVLMDVCTPPPDAGSGPIAPALPGLPDGAALADPAGGGLRRDHPYYSQLLPGESAPAYPLPPGAPGAATFSPPCAPPLPPVEADCGRLTRQPSCGCDLPQDLGCWSADPCRTNYVGAGLSFIPNVGLAVEAGRVFRTNAGVQWSVELQGAYQFIDDEDFVDDRNPSAGDFWQLRGGVKATLNPRSRRHPVFRAGVTWFQANGAPNIVEESGDYVGGYVSVGFETDLTPRVTVGPELSAAVATHLDDGGAVVLPQFTWRTILWLGGSRAAATAGQGRPRGELYFGGLVSASPGIGGGAEFGQVMLRRPNRTLSFELMAAYQGLPEGLFGRGQGELGEVRGGLKALGTPGSRAHWTLRAGVVWIRTTGPTDFLTTPGDYIGGYAGLGYEWDLGGCFRTGPELTLNVVTNENLDEGLEVVPQLNWHFIVLL